MKEKQNAINEETPHWVRDNTLIQSLLGKFIDKLDRKVLPQNLNIRINKTNAPQLFDHARVDLDNLWSLVSKELCDSGIVERIIYSKKQNPHGELYENARVYFCPDAEKQVRQWLSRPKIDPYFELWQRALESSGDDNLKRGLANHPIKHHKRSADDIVRGFGEIGNQLAMLVASGSSLGLRGLSARCFWGDSKFLDSHRDLITRIYPEVEPRIETRALLMSVHVPEQLRQAIFVENLESFRALLIALEHAELLNSTAVIYTSGFKGSARQLRDKREVVFSLSSITSVENKKYFESWWYEKRNSEPDCYFWGDFDYSGMAILAALRRSFKNMCAWEPGYSLILRYHQMGLGHSPDEAKKENQKPVVTTGCDYADHVLIPLLHSSQRFIDQEVISVDQLEKVMRVRLHGC